MRELPLLAVVAVVATGLVIGALGSWRAGALLIGAGVLLGAGLRLSLPVRRAGLLAVRGRQLDVAVLLALGAGLVVLAVTVPEAR